MNKDSQLIWEAYSSGINTELNYIIQEAKKEMEKGTGEPPVLDAEKEEQKGVIDRMTPVDKLQAALDIIGLDPTQTAGLVADSANLIISLGRFLFNALRGEKSEVKRHAINAAISAISLIPGADIVKVLKLRTLARSGKVGKAAAQAGVGALKQAKVVGKTAKAVRAGSSAAKLAQDDPKLAQAIQTAQGLQS